jgi:hypothetical protein
MPVSTLLPVLTFESARNSAFTENVETFSVNVIAIPITAALEERFTDVDGYRKNATRLTFEIELFEFSTTPKISGHDSGDKLAMIQFFDNARALRIKSVTQLTRYDGTAIPSIRAMIENRPIRITSISTALDKEAALESCTLSVESARTGV